MTWHYFPSFTVIRAAGGGSSRDDQADTQFLGGGSSCDDQADTQFLAMVEEARAAEDLVLPILKRNKAASSDSKALCDMLARAVARKPTAAGQPSSGKASGGHREGEGSGKASGGEGTLLWLASEMQRFQMNTVIRTQSCAHASATAAHASASAKEAAARKQAEFEGTRGPAAGGSAPLDLQALECWPRVRFKHSVLVVDPAGKGHFRRLSDALAHIEMVPPAKTGGDAGWSLILQPGSHTQLQWPAD